MKCDICGKEGMHETVEVSRRISDTLTGELKYTMGAVYTVCTHCDAITDYSATGKVTPTGSEYR